MKYNLRIVQKKKISYFHIIKSLEHLQTKTASINTKFIADW